ncbi:DNA-directed RNA polymerase subunit D [uncultured archaeon]|nr:DNA-directed RNA polymerase subunit D [uncultured archaeon]
MKTINKKNNQITFTLEADESLANAIRRYVDQIPILAVDEVEISKNDSPLYDETVAHRIGMIPLKMDKTIDEKSVEQLTLVAKKDGVIYSEELKGRVSPVYDKIPITVLKKGQELEILATAKVGKGSTHSKFSPGLMFYRNSVKVKIDKDCPKEVVNVCPQKILVLDNGKVAVIDEEKCDMCEACVDFCKKVGKDSIELIPSKELIITVESFGQISEDEIFKRAIAVLKDDLKEFAKKISK